MTHSPAIDPTAHLEYRIRVLPSQIRRAERKLGRLRAEAKLYNMKELLTNPEVLNEQWEKEIALAKRGEL